MADRVLYMSYENVKDMAQRDGASQQRPDEGHEGGSLPPCPLEYESTRSEVQSADVFGVVVDDGPEKGGKS